MRIVPDEEDMTLDALHATMKNFDYSCLHCVHLNKGGHTCAAFPRQIIDPIFTGEIRHLKPHPLQKNDIVFERKGDK